jgi:large subunit ribosomal protein L30
MAKSLLIRQVHSAIQRKSDQRRTLRALGLKKLNQEVVKPDNPQIRGMIKKVIHLLEVTEIKG